jgi:hypothetical protein
MEHDPATILERLFELRAPRERARCVVCGVDVVITSSQEPRSDYDGHVLTPDDPEYGDEWTRFPDGVLATWCQTGHSDAEIRSAVVLHRFPQP